VVFPAGERCSACSDCGLGTCPDHYQPWCAVVVGAVGERRQWQASAQPLQRDSGEDGQPLLRRALSLTSKPSRSMNWCGCKLDGWPIDRSSVVGLTSSFAVASRNTLGHGGFHADGSDPERQRRPTIARKRHCDELACGAGLLGRVHVAFPPLALISSRIAHAPARGRPDGSRRAPSSPRTPVAIPGRGEQAAADAIITTPETAHRPRAGHERAADQSHALAEKDTPTTISRRPRPPTMLRSISTTSVAIELDQPLVADPEVMRDLVEHDVPDLAA